MMAEQKKAVYDGPGYWPADCPVCGGVNLSRATVETPRGTGKDSWLCKDCGVIIERKGHYGVKHA